ncbi:ARM repeat-containing protein [Teratosphaeria nubilosa]|uniref:Sister chromatid cohesion protein n=1 Tax=Teratosphaeria nubilosa TaxID=161662 RepID=A0A6G1LF17_9PEZI|nr:ARM repeat-containing protein [Teratosphaeria nubilosa]
MDPRQWQQAANGHAPETNGQPGPSTGSTELRAPTVSQALPYTPFSSIVPFSPDVIPPPVVQPPIPSTYFGSTPEVQQTRQMLERLNEGATNAETASRRCQQTLADVQRLLEPNSLTQYQFKAIKRSNKRTDGASQNSYKKPSLSPFAKMVFDNTDVAYRYMTPESSEHDTKKAATSVQKHQVEPHYDGDTIAVSPRKPMPTPQSTQRPMGPQTNGHLAPSQPTILVNGSQASPLKPIIVQNKLTPAQLAEYQDFRDHDTIVVATPVQKSEDSLANRAVSLDQKHKGDMAVHNLQNYLLEIFEAEDQLQPDTSGAVSQHAIAIFTTRGSDDGSAPVLQPEPQARLEGYVQKVANYGRLENIETESLIRTQKICESAVNAAETLVLQVEEDWDEEHQHEWTFKLGATERALVAARTLLRIMGDGANVKELQSEDFLRATLAALLNVVDNCIVPTVEQRPSLHERIRGAKEEPPSNPRFITSSKNQKQLQSLLHAATKTFRVLGEFLLRVDVDESQLSRVIYLSKAIIFAENSNNERESILGVENFENARRCAMDVLAKTFAQYPEQRQHILQEILTSLEKLPATKQSARQFRLYDAKPIQLVSALLMRLVQTSATYDGEPADASSKAIQDSEAEDDVTDDCEEDSEDERAKATKRNSPHSQDLFSLAKPLHDAAQMNASYVVKMLMHKALTTSKTSDEPYRKLLDIFTEDFLNVLGSADWPAAELLIRTFVLHMINLVEGPKNPVPSRTLALEFLGTIGSGILGLQMSARNAARALDTADSKIAQRLNDLVQQLETGEVHSSSLVAFDGPYRILIEYLQTRGLGDAQLRSAHGFHLMQWASCVTGNREGSTDSDSSDHSRSAKDLQNKLKHMLIDAHWLEERHNYPTMATTEGRLAAMVVTLSSRLGQAFTRIFGVLIKSLNSEHPTVKSRSVKSVTLLIEKDPYILDRNAYVLNHILRSAGDASPLVRDSALQLMDLCTTKRPDLDKALYTHIIDRSRDTSATVRKRAMKMLKDSYLRSESLPKRSAIANALISRMEDTEESVKEIARQTIEEIWFMPFFHLKLEGDDAVNAKIRYGAQAGLLTKTVEASEIVGTALEGLIHDLVNKSKSTKEHTAVCKTMVKVLSDGIIDSNDIAGKPEQASILRCLAVFARASPRLFNAIQLERLEPYTQNLTSSDDLEVFQSVIAILRHVMPHQPTLKHDFLQRLQNSLVINVAKLSKSELAEVVLCLWTINGMLNNIERLVTLVTSAIRSLYTMKDRNFNDDPASLRRACKLMTIIGQFGKACKFDDHIASFKAAYEAYRGNSVAALMVEVLCPFTSPKQPVGLREASLEAVCTIAQAWPKLFLRSDVVNAFQLVFRDQQLGLERVLLSGLEGFFVAQEVSKGSEDVPALGAGVAAGQERLGKTYVATDQDGASTTIAQRFMQQILRLALSSSEDLAVVASRLIVSINRQGLVHPKESGPALVALETCPNTTIANMAFAEHKAQHSKHESLFDKEYMRAVQQAFEYQRDTLKSTIGYTGQPPVSKMSLLWEVLKTGKAQVRKKFLSNIVQKMDFNPAAIDFAGSEPQHLVFVRFCVENLAFFEYDRVEELLHLLTAMEKAFATTGTAVAQAIEADVLSLRVDTLVSSSNAEGDGNSANLAEHMPARADPERLRKLAVAAQVCSLIWETRSFIRRLWQMQKYTGKPKNAAKENNKAPSRATTAPALSDAYLRRIKEIMSVDATEETQLAICNSFLELISVDSEVKIPDGEENDMDVDGDEETPSEASRSKSPSVQASGGGRGRKRKPMGINGTPKKRARPSIGGKRKSSSAKLMDGDDEDGVWN